ncbi:MAG: cell division protein FtsZ [Candidatus Pacearchaeota archaeon]
MEIIEDKSIVKEIDKELEEILKQRRARIKVFGIGGAGNNTINRMSEVGIKGAELIAVNTDAQDLLYTNADYKILIGKELTKGLGAGSDPKIGEEAAKETENDIKKKLEDADLCFITCGLGGGTGTGASPVIAEIGKKLNVLTIAVVTLPFSIEGNRRYENAIAGLEKLESLVNTLIVIPNDKLLELAPDLPLQTAFKIADEVLTNAVKGIAELITKPGLVNLDFADVRAIMSNGGVSMIGVGENDSQNRAIEAVERALNNPLLDVKLENIKGALVNIVGGNDLTLDEARKIIEKINEKVGEDANLIWGAQISEDMQGIVRVLIIATGVKSPQIFGSQRTSSDVKKKEFMDELGIEFIEE